ncbi:MAG: hypothetical protein ABI625_12840 [bacterium]
MRNTGMRNYIKHTAIAAAMGLVAVSGASAQQVGAGARWQAWLGCWTSAPLGQSYGSAQFAAPVVCIVPTSNSDVVAVATIADGKIIKRDSIDASGRDKAVATKDCEGTQVARWSADDRRVYLSSTTSCGGMRSKASSILALTQSGEWLDVRGVSAGEGENVRVARYRDVGLPSSVPAEIADVLRGRSMSSQSARIAAGASIGTKAVTEATHSADPSVVEAWLMERGQRFALSATDLVTLADAGIPAVVTDAMVAVSNPDVFQLARADDGSESAVDASDRRSGRVVPVYMDPYYSPYGWGYSRYGYNGYGYGYGYGNGYGGYGGYYGGYGSPIIVVTGSQGTGGGGGNSQMVKGRGYTQNNPSSDSGRSASSGTSSPSGSSSGSSSSSGQSQPAPSQPSQPAEQRTAKPRP